MKIIKLIIKLLKYLLIGALLAFIVFFIILALSYKDLKTAASEAIIGKNALESSITAAKEKNWDKSLEEAKEAQKKIDNSLNSLNKIKEKAIFSKISLLENQILDLEYLLKTASLISHSLNQALPLAQKIDELYISPSEYTFSSLSKQEKAEFFQLIYESGPEINGLRANLELAKINLDKIKKIGILYPFYQKISDLKEEIEGASKLLQRATPLIHLLPALAGYPSSSDFLIIMHNNDELRPGGGFIGVFGLLEIENGEIIHLKTYDSYHLDMPAVGKWNMEPPEPIKKYMKVKNWYLRDANWSPDWPTSANKIQEIYQGESRAIGEETSEFTGIIGITPDFVSDLLTLVGPIEANNEIYTSDNLQSLLQYSVEIAYKEQDISSWDRKQVINDLLNKLKDRLLKLETIKLADLMLILENRAQTKDLQIYFNNSAWQILTEELGIDGKVEKTDDDYLLIVDANLAAFKSDAVVEKDINYQILFSRDKATAELELSYQHKGGFDWRTTRYRSYTRVYTPKGSKLNTIKALGQINLEEDSISSYDDVNLDKTVFAFFFTLEPGNEGGIKLTYNLPPRISDSWQENNYRLNVQKQAGRRTNSFQAIINDQIYQRDLDRDLTIIP
jgi:hypothetical protein